MHDKTATDLYNILKVLTDNAQQPHDTPELATPNAASVKPSPSTATSAEPQTEICWSMRIAAKSRNNTPKRGPLPYSKDLPNSKSKEETY
ncbi:hypothetical protein C0995_009238, partial [Termitomyces sp. Mi166